MMISHLHFIIDKVQKKAIEDREYSCGIFLDFNKAFDTVNHEILLTKLGFYCIRGIVKDWFTSYLSNRKQLGIILSLVR